MADEYFPSSTACRVEDGTPRGYRLVKRGGELTLQGAFMWSEESSGGFEWRDIPTVVEDQPPAAMSAEEHCRMFCAWKGGGPCLADDCPRRATHQPEAAVK